MTKELKPFTKESWLAYLKSIDEHNKLEYKACAELEKKTGQPCMSANIRKATFEGYMNFCFGEKEFENDG